MEMTLIVATVTLASFIQVSYVDDLLSVVPLRRSFTFDHSYSLPPPPPPPPLDLSGDAELVSLQPASRELRGQFVHC